MIVTSEEARLRAFARALLFHATGHRNRLLFSMRENRPLIASLLKFFDLESVEQAIVLEEAYYAGVGEDPFGIQQLIERWSR